MANAGFYLDVKPVRNFLMLSFVPYHALWVQYQPTGLYYLAQHPCKVLISEDYELCFKSIKPTIVGFIDCVDVNPTTSLN